MKKLLCCFWGCAFFSLDSTLLAQTHSPFTGDSKNVRNHATELLERFEKLGKESNVFLSAREYKLLYGSGSNLMRPPVTEDERRIAMARNKMLNPNWWNIANMTEDQKLEVFSPELVFVPFKKDVFSKGDDRFLANGAISSNAHSGYLNVIVQMWYETYLVKVGEKSSYTKQPSEYLSPKDYLKTEEGKKDFIAFFNKELGVLNLPPMTSENTKFLFNKMGSETYGHPHSPYPTFSIDEGFEIETKGHRYCFPCVDSKTGTNQGYGILNK